MTSLKAKESELQERLDEAVETENYKLATSLHHEMTALEEEIEHPTLPTVTTTKTPGPAKEASDKSSAAYDTTTAAADDDGDAIANGQDPKPMHAQTSGEADADADASVAYKQQLDKRTEDSKALLQTQAKERAQARQGGQATDQHLVRMAEIQRECEQRVAAAVAVAQHNIKRQAGSSTPSCSDAEDDRVDAGVVGEAVQTAANKVHSLAPEDLALLAAVRKTNEENSEDGNDDDDDDEDVEESDEDESDEDESDSEEDEGDDAAEN
jgi:hypothetical protein